MMIYIASPYSHSNPEVREERYTSVACFCAEKAREGHVVYSPIAHWHTIACAAELPTDFEYWQRHNYVMLEKADELWVYCLPGWTLSEGVQAECEYWQKQLKRTDIKLIAIDH